MWQEDLYFDPLATAPCCGLDLMMEINDSVCLAGQFTCDDSICHFSFQAEPWMSDNQTCPPTWTAAVETADLEVPQVEPEYLSKQACEGSVVRNTFIEVDTPASSPCMSRRRSQSVPRNLGCSDKEPHDDIFVSKPLTETKRSVALKNDIEFVSSAYSLMSNCGSLQTQETAKCVLCLSEFL